MHGLIKTQNKLECNFRWMKMYLNVSGGVLRSVVSVLIIRKEERTETNYESYYKINGRKNKDKLGNK